MFNLRLQPRSYTLLGLYFPKICYDVPQSTHYVKLNKIVKGKISFHQNHHFALILTPPLLTILLSSKNQEAGKTSYGFTSLLSDDIDVSLSVPDFLESSLSSRPIEMNSCPLPTFILLRSVARV